MAGLEAVELHLVDSVDEAVAMMRWLGERRDVLAVDTETSGLRHRVDRLRMVQLGDAQHGWSVPWERWGGAAVEALEKYEGRLVLHNAKFDALFLERCAGYRLPWRRVDDTMPMAHALEPAGSVALKTLCARHVDPHAPAYQSRLDEAMAAQGWTWETVPVDFPMYWAYGALDTVLTARLWSVLEPRVRADTDAARTYELEVAVTPVLAGMETRGLGVDRPFAEEQREKMLAWMHEAREWCYNEHGVNPTANTQVSRRLIELGVVLEKRTPTGAFSLDEEVLTAVGIEYGGAPADLATTVLGVRKQQKLVSTYLDHFIDDAVDGRVHGSIRALGAAKTGRMSITDPPMQTLPRADGGNPWAIAVRDCVVPTDGHKLVMVDYDQVEMRLLAHFSQDPTMLEVLSGAEDPFTEFARRIYGDDSITKKDPRRQLTKNASYAKAYGAGAQRFSLTAGVPLEQGRAFLAAYDERFPGVRAFQQHVDRVGRQRLEEDGEAWVRTPLGRRLTCDRDKVYKLVNYLIQGTASDLLKQKLVELDAAGFEPLLPVHDEVIFEFPEGEAEESGREAAAVMCDATSFLVPLPVGVDGPHERWGDKYR